MRIGEAARVTGVPERRIRFYEERGLLSPPRSEAGYRMYGREDIARIEFVKSAKLLGMTLGEIRELMNFAAGCDRGEVVFRLEDVLDEKLCQTEARLSELSSFRESLLFYRKRATALERREIENPCESSGFCLCLDAITREEVDMNTQTPCGCDCECCQPNEKCECGCDCCKDCA
jgi:MerR family transcriptional regulator, copper efflux regulator